MGREGGYSGFQVTGIIKGFGGGGGLKFSISGFFVAGKFWQVFFFYLSRDFFGYSKTNILYFPCYII